MPPATFSHATRDPAAAGRGAMARAADVIAVNNLVIAPVLRSAHRRQERDVADAGRDRGGPRVPVGRLYLPEEVPGLDRGQWDRPAGLAPGQIAPAACRLRLTG